MIPSAIGGDLRMLLQLALVPVFWRGAGWIGVRLGRRLESPVTRVARWYAHAALDADGEERDRPFPLRR